MKIYNIHDSKMLFNVLSDCEGTVQMVGDDGHRVTLKEDGNNNALSLLSGVYAKGSIDCIELHFNNTADVRRMIEFLVSAGDAAA